MTNTRRQCAETVVDVPTDECERLRYIAAVEVALTRDVLRMAYAYAEMRCLVLCKLGVPRVPEETVADALSDTLEQRRPWRGDDGPLASHLTQLIRSKTGDLMAQAPLLPHTSIHVICPGNTAGGRPDRLSLTRIGSARRAGLVALEEASTKGTTLPAGYSRSPAEDELEDQAATGTRRRRKKRDGN